jgi:POT family proton-dependent oligopeptide transporter
MGAWFYMTAVGNFVAGKIGEATGGEGGAMSKDATLEIYVQIGWVAIGVGAVVLLLSPIVKRWMHLDSLQDDVPDDVINDQMAGAAGVRPVTRPAE